IHKTGMTEPPTRTTIEARELILLDALGRKRIVLGTSQDSEYGPGLSLKDEDGVTRLVLSASKEGGAMVLVFDKSSKCNVSMGISSEGNAGFGINDSSGKTRAMLAVDDGHKSECLVLADKDGQGRVLLGIDPIGQAALNVSDKNGRIRGALGTDEKGNGKVSVRNNKNEKLFSVP